MIYNDQLVYKVVIWAFFGISLWTDRVTLKHLKKNTENGWLPEKPKVHIQLVTWEVVLTISLIVNLRKRLLRASYMYVCMYVLY